MKVNMQKLYQKTMKAMEGTYPCAEFKEEMAKRCEDVVRENSFTLLYKEAVIFKPDDSSIDEWSEEQVREYVTKTGLNTVIREFIADYVIFDKAMALIKDAGGSAEFKEEMAMRCQDALRECTLKPLYKEAVIFKPDDSSIDECSEEYVRKFVKRWSLDNMVHAILLEK